MTEHWIEVTSPTGVECFSLGEGLTRIGEGDAEVSVPGAGDDELHLWNDPPRVVFVGGGLPPTSQDVPFTERLLAPGDRFRWLGSEFRFGPEPDPPAVGQAVVTEVGPGAAPSAAGLEGATRAIPGAVANEAPAKALTGVEARIWNRMRAGLLVDQGLADAGTLQRLQKQALDGRLSLEEASLELLASAKEDDGGRLLLERSGRLMRDFVMASLNTRTRAVGRAAKRKTQNLVAFLVAQGVALAIFALIVGLILFFVRLRGVSLDAFFDALAPGG